MYDIFGVAFVCFFVQISKTLHLQIARNIFLSWQDYLFLRPKSQGAGGLDYGRFTHSFLK
jgi:hypothetical protein